MSRPLTATPRPAVLAALALGVLAGPLAGQQWRLDAQGGRYRLERGPVGSSSAGGVLGLRYLDGPSWFGLFAGVPVGEGAAPWGTAAAALRWSRGIGPLEAGLRVSGQASLQGDRGDGSTEDGSGRGPLDGLPLGSGGPLGQGAEPSLSGWGASAEVTPLLAVGRGPLRVEARGGGAHYHSDFRDHAFDRSVGVAHLRVSVAPRPSLHLSLDGSGYWAEEGTYPYVGASAVVAGSRASARASVGTWLDDGIETVPWSLGTSVDALDRVSLEASVRRDAVDPLFLTPARTSWSVGVSVRLSDLPRAAAPVPSRYEDGEATIVLPAGDAGEAPRVAGDFNDWTAEPMIRDGDHWSFRVRIEPGVYYYAFVSADGEWFVPESVPGRKDDGFGGHTAVLVVE